MIRVNYGDFETLTHYDSSSVAVTHEYSTIASLFLDHFCLRFNRCHVQKMRFMAIMGSRQDLGSRAFSLATDGFIYITLDRYSTKRDEPGRSL